MANEQILEKALQLRQQSEETEQQLGFVNEQLEEMDKFYEKLKMLEDSSEKEILAPLGRGVYIKSERNVEEKLFVEAGAGVVVRKTPSEAREVVKEQMEKFKEARMQLLGQLQEYSQEFAQMLGEIEHLKGKHS